MIKALNRSQMAWRVAQEIPDGSCVNLGIGLITPPVGAVLFVGSAVAKLRIEQVVQAMWPFFVILFSVLILVTYVPAISLWLPGLFGV